MLFSICSHQNLVRLPFSTQLTISWLKSSRPFIMFFHIFMPKLSLTSYFTYHPISWIFLAWPFFIDFPTQGQTSTTIDVQSLTDVNVFKQQKCHVHIKTSHNTLLVSYVEFEGLFGNIFKSRSLMLSRTKVCLVTWNVLNLFFFFFLSISKYFLKINFINSVLFQSFSITKWLKQSKYILVKHFVF